MSCCLVIAWLGNAATSSNDGNRKFGPLECRIIEGQVWAVANRISNCFGWRCRASIVANLRNEALVDVFGLGLEVIEHQ